LKIGLNIIDIFYVTNISEAKSLANQLKIQIVSQNWYSEEKYGALVRDTFNKVISFFGMIDGTREKRGLENDLGA